MKRLLTLLVVLIAASTQLSAQLDPDRRPLHFGLDFGGTFQTSDMKPLAGIGWGFNFSRYTRMSNPGPLYFGWRARFLDGRNYGYNYHPLSGLGSDYVMSHYPTNYADSSSTGYVFSNYKFRNDEFAFELIIGDNALRKKGVLLYAFGGAGLNYWKTTTNQLNAQEGMYDYSGINFNGDDAIVRSQLKQLWDNTYETNANGSGSAPKWSFMPSAGIGFGYEFRSGFALGVEHRTTFALNDVIDGVNHDNLGNSTKNKDMYHTCSFYVRWTIGGKKSTETSKNTPPPPPNPNNYTQQPNNNPPNNTTYPTTGGTTGGGTTGGITPGGTTGGGTGGGVPGGNVPPLIIPPAVTFTTPSTDPYNATTANQQLVVRVEHVTMASQISLTINNQVSTSFSFNPVTNTMVFNHTLNPGTNVYQVVATNQAGSASDIQTIYFKSGEITTGNPPTMPPAVTITNPATDPFTSPTATYNVMATVLNVTSAANIQVRRNGNPVTNFTFDPNTHMLNFVANLQNGSNLYEVVGTNNYGSASDQVTINYNPVAAVQPPVVTVTSPASCPYTVKSPAFTITASIQNVTTANQVSIIYDNQQITNFTFQNNGRYATVSFPVTLNAGSNYFTITATNTGGTDAKSCQIILKTTTQQVTPPTVTITAPATSPYTSASQSYTVNATVLNVNSQNEITVTFNNAVVTNWTYNMSSHNLTLPTNLNVGTNVVTVSASNANGADSKNTTIVYQPAALAPPVVDITTPAVNPFISGTSTVSCVATVLNVTSSSQVTVTTLTGQTVPFSYSGGAHMIMWTANLNAGANVYTVTATNAAGTASDNTTIKFVAQSGGTTAGGAGSPVPSGRPQNTPSGGGNPPNVNNVPTPPNSTGNASTGNLAVNLVTPSTESYTVSSSVLNVTMQVLGVSGSSEISVRVNNLHVMNFNYDAGTHNLTFIANLNQGVNTITVTAQNNSGVATKVLTVTYAATGRTGGSSTGGSSTGGRGGSSTGGEKSSSSSPSSSESTGGRGNTSSGGSSSGSSSSSSTPNAVHSEPSAAPTTGGRGSSTSSEPSHPSSAPNAETRPSQPAPRASSTPSTSRPR